MRLLPLFGGVPRAEVDHTLALERWAVEYGGVAIGRGVQGSSVTL